jgi:hypothetical protein
MKKTIIRIFLPALTGILLWSCYPDGAEYYEETDVVYTTYDVDFDFQTSQTYALPDKIVTDVDISGGDTTYTYMKDIYAKPILQAIDQNMLNYGWSKVDISKKPDVVLSPAAISTTTVFYSYWYDWWYGGYYGGWGWYYPPYYVSSYTVGSLVITMANPNIDNPINQSKTAWVMVGNGLVSGAGNVDRVIDALDQAFDQSPYLKLN